MKTKLKSLIVIDRQPEGFSISIFKSVFSIINVTTDQDFFNFDNNY